MSERPEIISRKSPNMSFSRDFAKLWKTSDFQQNLQTRAFHKIYLAAKKRDFQEISKHKPFTRPYKAVKKTQRFSSTSPAKHEVFTSLSFWCLKHQTPNLQTRPVSLVFTGRGKASHTDVPTFLSFVAWGWVLIGKLSKWRTLHNLYSSFWTEIYLF